MNIGIIGGGFTGLTAAYELLKKGHHVTIFERGRELGGLAAGFKIGGTSIERAYHHIFKTDTEIIDLVEELGLVSKLEWMDSSVSTYYDGVFYPFRGALDLLKFKPLSFFSRIRLGLITLYIQKEKNWRKFIKISAVDWLQKYAGKEIMERFWNPLLKGKFHNYYQTVSMAWLWARLHIRTNSRKFGEGEKLGYFNGGFQIIVDELVKRITEMGGTIRTGVDVRKLGITNDEFPIMDLPTIFIEKEGKDERVQFDKVICTVPSHVFAKLIENNPNLPEGYIEKLNSIEYLGAICMIFTSDQDLTDYYWHNINDPEAPFVAFINHTKLIPKERYGNKNVYYLGAYLPHEHEFFAMTEDEVTKVWFDYLHKMLPNFDSNKVNEKFLFKARNAQHIVDLDYEAKIPDYVTPVKNVYLSNFSQIFPEDRGTNFAVREGRKIVKVLEG
jgi:protoporphyrinogen oxidase